MLIRELYNLWIIEIKKGNRILSYKNFSTGIYAEYTYKGIFKFKKAVSAARYFQFLRQIQRKKTAMPAMPIERRQAHSEDWKQAKLNSLTAFKTLLSGLLEDKQC